MVHQVVHLKVEPVFLGAVPRRDLVLSLVLILAVRVFRCTLSRGEGFFLIIRGPPFEVFFRDILITQLNFLVNLRLRLPRNLALPELKPLLDLRIVHDGWV